MTAIDPVSIVTSLAALGASVGTFLTIGQMVKQRKESYRPTPTLLSTYFIAKIYHDNRYHFETQVQGGQYEPNLFLNLANAGLGSAIEVEVVFQIPEDDLRVWAEHLPNIPSLQISPDAVHLGYLDTIEHHNRDPQERIRIPFLLRADTAAAAERILVPNLLASLMRVHLSQPNDLNSTQFPKIPVHVAYRDIGRKVFKREYILVFQPFFAHTITTEPGVERLVHGQIRVEQ